MSYRGLGIRLKRSRAFLSCDFAVFYSFRSDFLRFWQDKLYHEALFKRWQTKIGAFFLFLFLPFIQNKLPCFILNRKLNIISCKKKIQFFLQFILIAIHNGFKSLCLSNKLMSNKEIPFQSVLSINIKEHFWKCTYPISSSLFLTCHTQIISPCFYLSFNR